MMTSHFYPKMQSQVAKPVLDRLITSLESDFEEFLRREVCFVKQCYESGRGSRWRKILRVGLKIPDDSTIKEWILLKQNAPTLMCLNPKIMPLAIEHFHRRASNIVEQLIYLRQLRRECELSSEIEVSSEYASFFSL
jgi:hypothetical protein